MLPVKKVKGESWLPMSEKEEKRYMPLFTEKEAERVEVNCQDGDADVFLDSC